MFHAAAVSAAVFACGACAVVGPDQPGDRPAQPRPHAVLSLITSTPTVEPGGTFDVGVSFAIERGWHLYWNGKNDSGMPPEVTLTLPEGFVAGPTRWPAPARHLSPGDILDHIYEDEVTLIIPVTTPKAARAGDTAPISADCRWLVCQRVCVPEAGKAEATVRVASAPDGAGGHAPPAPIARARGHLPGPIGPDAGISIDDRRPTDGREVVISARGATRLEFYPDNECVELVDPIHDARADGDRMTLRIGGAQITPDKAVRGVLGVWSKEKAEPAYYEVGYGPRR